ncbi:hypothetical protein KVT40_001460 [Elsinoe batatas]|uniref:Aminoglycoside phosphotransferase domain-containing protein n=1 Tax=Elsinoe batatas TaxID=2601811 RepID=A0A8K0L8R5_9PEZI|nr:hypothetical protein KVT40_001460 [Elsinoe batatas]
MSALLLKFRLWLGRKFYGELGPGVIKVSRNRVIKGPCRPSEAEAMRFVQDNTAIPLPKVYREHQLGQLRYIEMEFVQGEDLERAWGKLTHDQKSSVIQEITLFVSEMRQLTPPTGRAVSSATGNAKRDGRVGSRMFGPFKDHSAFHSLLHGHLSPGDVTQAFGPEVMEVHSRDYKTMFTHADICLRNVIVRDGKVAALIDWAYAGWYPEYWEYTKLHYGQLNVPDWYGPLSSSLARYEEELQVERLLWSRLDWPADQVQDV